MRHQQNEKRAQAVRALTFTLGDAGSSGPLTQKTTFGQKQ